MNVETCKIAVKHYLFPANLIDYILDVFDVSCLHIIWDDISGFWSFHSDTTFGYYTAKICHLSRVIR